MTEKEIKVNIGMAEQGKFTEFMKEKRISTGIVIILLMIAWISGFIWKGLYI